jgi:hypothetical protein
MDPLNNPSTTVASATSGTSSIWSYIFNTKILAFLIIAGGITMSVISKTTNSTSPVANDNFFGGGIIIAIVGVAILGMTTGFFSQLRNFATTVPGGTIFSIILVLAVVFIIFTILFYNFSNTEALPFATGVLIALSVIAVLGVLFVFSGRKPLASLITRFVFALYHFLPHALFVFGIFFDILNRKVEFTPGSFAGLTGVMLNYIFSLALNKGVVPVVSNPLCEVPGLSQFTSNLVPQPMMFALSIIAYIATYISRSPTGPGFASNFAVSADFRWPAWVAYFSVWAIQAFVLWGSGCNLSYYQLLGGLIAPLGYGGLIGIAGYSFLEGRSGSSTSNASSSRFLGSGGIQKCPDGSIPDANGICGSNTPTCSAVGNGDEFVCETFKNGKLETTVMTE